MRSYNFIGYLYLFLIKIKNINNLNSINFIENYKYQLLIFI